MAMYYHANPWLQAPELEAALNSPIKQTQLWSACKLLLIIIALAPKNKQKTEMSCTYQSREYFLSCSTWHRKSTMSAGVTGSQNFAKVVCWLFTWSA